MYELAKVWLGRHGARHGETAQARFASYCENGDEVLVAAEEGFLACARRDDLPSVTEIVDRSIRQRMYLISTPCLLGMDLRWLKGKTFVDQLGVGQLQRMLAFRLTNVDVEKPAWSSYLVRTRPDCVAGVLCSYASATFKVRKEVHALYALANDASYRTVAELTVVPLLSCFPVRGNATVLPSLEYLLKAALRYCPEQLKGLLEQKLALKSMDVAQRVFWLTSAMLLDPARYESDLWRYIGKAAVRANYLYAFISDRFHGLNLDYELSAASLSRLIEIFSPQADLVHRSGLVTPAMEGGTNVRFMITRLGALATQEAAEEIERLLSVAATSQLKDALLDARYQLKLRQREGAFRFSDLQSVVSVLANRHPANVADLAALTLTFLEQIADEIRHDNDDGFHVFWNIEHKQPKGKREENRCRDALMTRLRSYLSPFGVACQPERDCANDKRADLVLSYRNDFELPVEIKRDDNRELWRAPHRQLIAQYASARKAYGYGVYLVLWFGCGDIPPPRDSGEKPVSPGELQSRLEMLLAPEERQCIFIRVIDVSWPQSTA